MQSKLEQSIWKQLVDSSGNPEAFTALIKENPGFWNHEDGFEFPSRLFPEYIHCHNAFRLAIDAIIPEAVEFLLDKNRSFLTQNERALFIKVIRDSLEENAINHFSNKVDRETLISNISNLNRIFKIAILNTGKTTEKFSYISDTTSKFIHIYGAYGAVSTPELDQAGQMLFDLACTDTRHNPAAKLLHGELLPHILAKFVFNKCGKTTRSLFSNNANQCLEALLFRTAIDSYPQAKNFEEAKVLHRQVLKEEYVKDEAEKMSQIILKAIVRDLNIPMLGLLFSPNHHPLYQWLGSTLLEKYETFGGALDKKLAIRIMTNVENAMLANIHQDVATVESAVRRVTSNTIERSCVSIN
jgi:hypothetical protein